MWLRICAKVYFILSQSTRLTDGQADRQTDGRTHERTEGQTERLWKYLALHYMQSHVKKAMNHTMHIVHTAYYSQLTSSISANYV